MIGITW